LYQNLSNSKSEYFDTQFVTFMLRSALFLEKVIISIRDLFVKYGSYNFSRHCECVVQGRGFLDGVPLSSLTVGRLGAR
jgi:hypothetical protein